MFKLTTAEILLIIIVAIPMALVLFNRLRMDLAALLIAATLWCTIIA